MNQSGFVPSRLRDSGAGGRGTGTPCAGLMQSVVGYRGAAPRVTVDGGPVAGRAGARGKGAGIIEKMRTDRAVLAFSLLAAAYFAFLALDYYVFRLNSILLGVVRELLTIPLMLAAAVAFVFSVVRLASDRQSVNARMVSGALILFAVNCFIWGSFVF